MNTAETNITKARWPVPLRETTSVSCTCLKGTGTAWCGKTDREFLRRSSSLASYLLVLQENGNTEVKRKMWVFCVKTKY